MHCIRVRATKANSVCVCIESVKTKREKQIDKTNINEYFQHTSISVRTDFAWNSRILVQLAAVLK